jgi:hypothetical protein
MVFSTILSRGVVLVLIVAVVFDAGIHEQDAFALRSLAADLDAIE